MGGFTPPLGRGDPCALMEPCTKPCTTATPLPCMAHLSFIPHPLTGEEVPQGGSQSGPSVMMKQLCDSSLGISAIPFLRSSNQLFCSRAQLASLFFVVGMLRCPEPLIDRVQWRKVACYHRRSHVPMTTSQGSSLKLPYSNIEGKKRRIGC